MITSVAFITPECDDHHIQSRQHRATNAPML
jgi:hypothetical protein